MTEEPKKPSAKPVEAEPVVPVPPAQQQEKQPTPKAQFVKSDHKVFIGTDSATPTAQFTASDHKIALRASKNKTPQRAVPPKPPKK